MCPSGCRYARIQQAIDAAQPEQTITIGPGEYTERLVIDKSLVLNGAGYQSGSVETRVLTQGAVVVGSDRAFAVEITGLRLDGSPVLERRSACVGEAETCTHGMVVRGRAHVILKQVEIINNAGTGLWVKDSAEVELNDALLERNPTGVRVTDTAKLSSLRARIHAMGLQGRNNAALATTGQAQVSLVAAQLASNVTAVVDARGESVVEIRQSRLTAFLRDWGSHGVVADERARVTLRESAIEGNYGRLTNRWCHGRAQEEQLCSGITLAGEAQLTLFSVAVTNHVDWGLAAHLKRCGYAEDRFAGRVIVEGRSKFEGNNSSGNLAGLGNPGSHAWTTAGLPDGQVCLP